MASKSLGLRGSGFHELVNFPRLRIYLSTTFSRALVLSAAGRVPEAFFAFWTQWNLTSAEGVAPKSVVSPLRNRTCWALPVPG